MTQFLTSQNRLNLLSAYVTDLELEVDRLRKQLQHVCQAGREVCNRESAASKENRSNDDFRQMIDDIRDDVHAPLALDRIEPIAIREFIESIYRWQQRLENRPANRLVLTLDCEQVAWFPVRLRHILQNLLGNAIRYGDPEKGENRVNVTFKTLPGGYELRVTDKGVGMPETQWAQLLQPTHRTSGKQGSDLGVGIAIVKHLVEQSGGELNIDSGEGMGSCFVVTLPSFASGDFLE
ncbi:sensor histidine kinase [Anatilimnocola floriformis]|uniref:sensor histidine kinase n=1 Tax=Anatilimnocola floriformis TaxID=2948575 RepID=UPI0020C4DAC2|nr:ATP-binding protein [Anatilimnocola floriformis]